MHKHVVYLRVMTLKIAEA